MTKADDQAIMLLVGQLAQRLLAQKLRLVCAESCTGGWLAKVITDLSGASSWFEASLTVYSNVAKQRLLGVPAATIGHYGAVSQETVEAMASGGLAVSGADIAVAVSGIAGPHGGDQDKPIGTVWIAWQRLHAKPLSRHFQFDGDREAIRRQSIIAALEGLLQSGA